MKSINIDEEMRTYATAESQKRHVHIKHHFEVTHFSDAERDETGFLGEFSCCKLLGIDWKANIRDNYLTIDHGDGHCSKGIFDVKTETIPEKYFQKVVSKQISADQYYGCRWINEDQVPLLKKYDIIIFGAFCRENISKWYPLGWLETAYITKHYRISSGDNYHRTVTPALKIKTSDLKSIDSLVNIERI